MQLRKLIPATVIATTAIAVALACLGLSTYYVGKARQTLVAELESLGEILATHATVALSNGDAGSAELMLLSLGARGDVEAAALFDAAGEPFAQYVRDYDAGIAIPDRPGTPGTRFGMDSVQYVREIVRGDQRIGSVYLRASTLRLTQMRTTSVLIGGVVFLLSVIPGMLAAARLVRSVARPLAALADASARTASGDLRGEVRATAVGGEIGALEQTFRDMTAKLRSAVTDIVAGSGAITQATEGLQGASQRTAAHSERQQGSVRSMSAALTGVSSGVEETRAQIEALTELAERVSSCGLEMQAVTGSVGEAVEHLFSAIDENADAARGTAKATAQISEIAAALDRSAASSGASIERLAGAIDALRVRAARGSERANAAAAASRDGADSARLTMDAVNGVHSAHNSLIAVVMELSGKSTAIEGVLQIVDDVIDATRLLALNAAITAAQAGEQGAGFAVVAGRIRELAGRTSASTAAIAGHLADLRRAIAAAVEGNAAIGVRLSEGARQAKHTDSAFAHLLEAAGEFAAESGEINALAEGQATALDQVRPTLERVREQVAEIEEAISLHGHAAEAIAKSMDHARALGSEVQGAMGQQGQAARQVAVAVEDLRERLRFVQTAAAAQLAAVSSIRQELAEVADATHDGVALAGGMLELVASLGTRAQELERSAARFRLPESIPADPPSAVR